MTAYNATMYNKETFNNIDRVIGIVTRGAPFLKWGTRVFLSFPKLLFIRSEHMLKIRELYEMALFWLVKVSPSWKIQFLRCAPPKLSGLIGAWKTFSLFFILVCCLSRICLQNGKDVSPLSPLPPKKSYYATVKLCRLQKFNRFTIAQLYGLRRQLLVDGWLGKWDFLWRLATSRSPQGVLGYQTQSDSGHF